MTAVDDQIQQLAEEEGKEQHRDQGQIHSDSDDDDDDDDDGPLALSSQTFAALAEFYREQEEREQLRGSAGTVEEEDLKEDWQLSQFWYSKETADRLARIVLKVVGSSGRIACVSAPTLYRHLKKLTSTPGEDDATASSPLSLTVFEYDKRFAVYGTDFVFYDYRSPLDIPRELRESFDLVFADPPFLSEECLTKTAVTLKYLAKERIVLCTGAVMADLADRLLSLKLCKFEPKHENNLANEFRCYANFDLDAFCD